MRNKIIGTSVLAGLLTLTACGGSDGGSTAPTGPGARPEAPAGTLKSENAKSMAKEDGAAADLNSKLNPFKKAETEQETPTMSFHFDSRADLAAFQHARQLLGEEECKPTESGDTTDADKDTVAVSSVQTFNCNIDSKEGGLFGGMKLTMTGNVKSEDEDDAKAFPIKGGTWTFEQFKSSFAFSFGTAGEGQTPISFSVDTLMNGTHKVSVDADMKSTLEINMQTAVSGSGLGESTSSSSTTSSTPTSITTNEWVTVTTTPDDKTNIEKSGAMTIDGYIGLITTESLTLKIASTDLKYGCPKTALDDAEQQVIKSGTITYTDAANNKIAFTWTDCDKTPKKTFNGEAI